MSTSQTFAMGPLGNGEDGKTFIETATYITLCRAERNGCGTAARSERAEVWLCITSSRSLFLRVLQLPSANSH